MIAPTPPALRAQRPRGATSPPTTTMPSAISARRVTSPIQATAPTRAATSRRKFCSSLPTASRTKRAVAAACSRRSTTLAMRPAVIRAGPTGARRSRTAASRSRSSIPTISPFRPTAGTRAGSPLSSRTSARRCKPAPHLASSMTRRSARTSDRRWRRCSPR